MRQKNLLLLLVVGLILCTEGVTLFVMRPTFLMLNTALAVLYLFLSGALLYDFTYRRHLQTLTGVFLYGATAVLSLVLAEAIALMYASYLYPLSFHHHAYTSAKALGNALILFTGYGYPQISGQARGIVVFLMIYSWIVNVLLLSKLISIFQKKLA